MAAGIIKVLPHKKAGGAFHMSLSRRGILAAAPALAVAGAAQPGLAKRTLWTPPRTPDAHPAQQFLQLLIHKDEAHGEPFSAMIWVSGPDSAWYAVNSLSKGEYLTSNSGYKRQGYRLRRVSAFQTKEGVEFAGCWENAKGPDWHSRHSMTHAEFVDANTQFAAQGYRLAHVDARVGYAAIWERGEASTQRVLAGLPTAQYMQQYSELNAQDFHPVRISTAAVGNDTHYSAIFEKNDQTAWRAYHSMDAAQLAQASSSMTSQGFRMTDASGHMLHGKPNFTGIWTRA
jgi:hypothetical protein